MITLTLPLDNADALLRGSDMLAGLAKDARMKEPLPQRRELREVAPVDMEGVVKVLTGEAPELEAPEFDADGLPWDERIHASTKTTTQDGRWKKKRGVDQSLVEEVEAELRYTEEESSAQDAAVDSDPNAADGAPTGTISDAATPPPPPPPPPPASDTTFAELIKEITENQINPDTVLKAIQSVGLANAGELFARPDLIPQVARELGLES